MSDVLHSDPSHMLVSILEEFCNNYAKDTGKAKQLFNLICDQLREQEIITPKCFVDENLCKPARKCFQDILQKSWQEITKDGNTQGSQSSKSIRYESLGSSFDEESVSRPIATRRNSWNWAQLGKGVLGLSTRLGSSWTERNMQ
ncbi:uncharacterized protein LOC143286115 isoform X2 [Babylonia areolata]|uniref:uncharacterized protein LOC143286115 isoform X2 n=1 Tax=Babylonia areolata TaxID=304850 RepID=UPI003FD46D45